MSLNNDQVQRHKTALRDVDARNRITTNDGHLFNLPPPPPVPPSSTTMRPPSSISGNLNILPPPSAAGMFSDTLTPFQRERFNDVLQHGTGTYVFIENFGLVPKLNHF